MRSPTVSISNFHVLDINQRSTGLKMGDFYFNTLI